MKKTLTFSDIAQEKKKIEQERLQKLENQEKEALFKTLNNLPEEQQLL